jgi:hypothetical protein
VAGWHKGGNVAVGYMKERIHKVLKVIPSPACETKNSCAVPKPLKYIICDYI